MRLLDAVAALPLMFLQDSADFAYDSCNFHPTWEGQTLIDFFLIILLEIKTIISQEIYSFTKIQRL